MEVINQINKLRLEYLNEDWAQAIYYSEFLDFTEIPSEYENILESLEIHSVFCVIIESIDNWINSNSEQSEEKSWQYLSQHFQHDKFVAIIAYYINLGCKNVLTKEYRDNALLASRLYYKLLLIPGYKAFHIYHSQLFAHSITCLTFPKVMCENTDNYYGARELTTHVNSVIKDLRYFVHDLNSIIAALQLTPNDMHFEDILSNLIDITGCAIVNKPNIDKIQMTNICVVVYEMIHLLLCDSNGDSNPVAITLLFKCLLPKLLAVSTDMRSANNLVRASYVTYSGVILTQYGKAALPSFNVLLQHICYTADGLDRAEVRSARVSLITGLMSLLPYKSYQDIIKWLIKLSTTYRPVRRQITLDIISNLLSKEPEDINPTESNTNSTSVNTNQEIQESNSELNGNIDSLSQSEDNQVEPQEILATNENSQNSHDSAISSEIDPEGHGWLDQRQLRLPLTAILHAVHARTFDSSGTVRVRALQIFADSLASQHPPLQRALKGLSGVSEAGNETAREFSQLSAVAARGACDERASVRRVTVSLVHRLLLAAGDPLPQDLAILIGLCRDAAILVRSAAIAALGELVIERPCEATIDAFISGPLHQLSDPETKVQDIVAQHIQKILMDRLQKYDASEVGNSDPLPWMFLEGIVRHNKRRHMQKACTLLASRPPNCINYRLVDILSTHLDVDCDARDLQCLVLLTSLAKHVDYNDVTFIFEYYYKLADNIKSHDSRVVNLTLELCGAWARWAGDEARGKLRHRILVSLATMSNDCRIACIQLAAQLDPTDLTWANDLMHLSEQRALNSGGVEEWIRAADLSLVAPTPPSAALLNLFLNALDSFPSDWEESLCGAVVAGAGRLCVRSRSAAAAAAPRLAALLAAPALPHAARHNALLALSDICARYACIVEPQLEALCGCLRGGAALLRQAAARALTRLLLGDYLRLRIPLYYRYCALLADEDRDVREPAEYYVTSCLPTDAIYQHFVDCVIYYNKDDTEKISFDSRQLIYDVMLQRMTIVQKLNIQCRLAREVLEHAADVTDEGDGQIPPALHAALLDTITLLCGPRMKLPKKSQNNGDAADNMDDLQERVTSNIVSHKMKCTVAEVVVPAVLRLYARLRTAGGQLPVYLVRIANDLLQDYRAEIEELIENNDELVSSVQQYQETIGVAPTFGNTRNLVTSSAAADPETPRAPRRRPPAARGPRSPIRKRPLRL